MTEHVLTNALVARAREEAARIEAQWNAFHDGSPKKPGYYHVRDCEGRDGVAFMNRNKTWTLIDNRWLRKPLVKWRDIK